MTLRDAFACVAQTGAVRSAVGRNVFAARLDCFKCGATSMEYHLGIQRPQEYGNSFEDHVQDVQGSLGLSRSRNPSQ